VDLSESGPTERPEILTSAFGRVLYLGFLLPRGKLAVELDGEAHAGPIAAAHDAERTAYLQSQGIEVLRFENRVVWDMPEALLNRIREGFRS